MQPTLNQVLLTLDTFLETASILLNALEKNDDDKAHEAVTILLMQAVTFYGVDHPVMQHLFPVLDMIKQRIDAMEINLAIEQTQIFVKQIKEIKELVKNPQKS